MRLIVLSLLTLMISSSAANAVPARIPIQGRLTDSAAMPVTGSKQIHFKLYDDANATTAWYTETQIVQVEQGDFTVYLGSVTPLDISNFKRGTAFLGITLQNEAEMAPRLEMSSVPFATVAAFAEETAAVPPGAVMMFDLDTCPPGWTAFEAARGRTIVGVPAGGTRGGTVGTPFSDLENRAHAHTVNPGTVAATPSGAHFHTVDLNQMQTTSDGTHNHEWSWWDNVSKIWKTFNELGAEGVVIDWTLRGGEIGMDTVGEGNHPFSIDNTQPISSRYFYTKNDGDHHHSINPPATATTNVPDHNHFVDVGPTTSSVATTSSVVPYLQLLICRKQ